jgi:hypothetical protein
MLFIGLDDTDMPGAPGTNQLARPLALELAEEFDLRGVTRHQLLIDPRIPYTAKNSSAAIMLRDAGEQHLAKVAGLVRGRVRERAAQGSDPGICIVEQVVPDVVDFGLRAKREVLCQAEAREVAGRTGCLMEALGGDGGGIIGALAAVGLAATGEDGRFVQLERWPDDLSGPQPADELRRRGVEAFIAETDGALVEPDAVDIGKRLRPSYRSGRAVLFVQRVRGGWQAVRKT